MATTVGRGAGQGIDTSSFDTGRTALPSSARRVEVCLRFGVPMDPPVPVRGPDVGLDLAPGTITLIAGPSGSGKTLLIENIARRFPTSRRVEHVPFPLDVAVLDAIAPTRSLAEGLGLLTACGLGEPAAWIRRFDRLSDGEQFRARLARAISLQRPRDGGGSAPLLCDEFGALLHRRLTRAVAFNLRKLVTRERLTLVVATSRDDIERDLRPDGVVRFGGNEPVLEQASRVTGSRWTFSLARQLRIEPGTLHDYQAFADMHYRQREQVGFVDKVFVMRCGSSGERLGAVVYGRPPLELAPRNRVTGGRFIRRAKLLNREMRVLKRLVIHPDVRGCGLGHWLVRRTLGQVGTRFVECLAAMGAINPVFEKAGMRRVGVCRLPASLSRTLRELRSAGADPLNADFVAQVCRRRSVRRLVSSAVHVWYRSATSENRRRIEQLAPTAMARTFRQLVGSEPVYFIWAADREGKALIERERARVTGAGA